MNKPKKKSATARTKDFLRRKAEQVLEKRLSGDEIPEECARTIHELRVYKVELEMQNEELRRSQEDLSMLREKYAELYDYAPVGYFTLDRLGKILDVNITGYNLVRVEKSLKEKDTFADKEMLRGKPFTIFVQPEDRHIFADHLREVIDRRTLQKCELRLGEPGRHFFHAQLQSIAFGKGKDLHCRTVVTDITDFERLRSDREEYIRDLESFGTAASHELRGPLISISRFSQILMEDYGKCIDEEGRKVVEIISEKARDMETLLTSLLEFSKISTTQIRKRDIRMNDLIDKVCKDLVHGKKIKVRLEIKSVPHAKGDPALIGRALSNLIANALKYSAQSHKPVVEIGGYIKHGETIYSVKDNGVGFDSSYAFKLFDLFQRLHSKKEFPGTGTGLYIVRRIAEKHGGRVWAESQRGEGATFYFALPIE